MSKFIDIASDTIGVLIVLTLRHPTAAVAIATTIMAIFVFTR